VRRRHRRLADQVLRRRHEGRARDFHRPDGHAGIRALRHLFTAERAASKIPDIPDDTPTRKIAKVGVIGAGTMGGGITMNFLNAGIPVTMLEMKQEALDKGVAIIRKNYENSMKKGKLSQEKLDQRMGLLKSRHCPTTTSRTAT
jgi:3-hydroxyacyl-CoA dehydrogenase